MQINIHIKNKQGLESNKKVVDQNSTIFSADLKKNETFLMGFIVYFRRAYNFQANFLSYKLRKSYDDLFRVGILS